MPRINVEDDIESRFEFKELVRILNGNDDQALGMLIRFWRLALRHWGNDKLVPKEEIIRQKLQPIIDSGWGIETPDGVKAYGAEKQFAWYREKKQGNVRGGKSRAATASRDEKGHFVSQNSPGSIQVDSRSTQVDPAPSSALTLSPSLTLSQKKENTYCTERSQSSPYGAVDSLRGQTLVEELLNKVKKSTQEIWLQMYGDPSWVQRELAAAAAWIDTNPQRAPRSNWGRFLNTWLSRSWERYRKTQPTTKISIKPIQLEDL